MACSHRGMPHTKRSEPQLHGLMVGGPCVGEEVSEQTQPGDPHRADPSSTDTGLRVPERWPHSGIWRPSGSLTLFWARASARQGGGSPFRRLLSGPVTSCLSASAQHAHPHPARGRPSPYYCRHGYLSSPSYFVRASLSWESEELSMVLAAVMGQEWSRDPTTQSR